MDGLEKQIKELIECLYNCIYIGDIKVTKENNYYTLTLKLWNLPYDYSNVTYGNQCDSDEEFLEYLKKVLKENRLDLSHRGHLKLLN